MELQLWATYLWVLFNGNKNLFLQFHRFIVVNLDIFRALFNSVNFCRKQFMGAIVSLLAMLVLANI